MNKVFSLVVKAFFFILLILMGAAFLLPILYKKEITESVRKIINENINGEFKFKDASPTLFRDFPNLSLEIDKPELYSFVANDTSRIFAANEFVIYLNLWNIISRKEVLKIKGLELNSPDIFLKIYNDTLANYDLVQSTGKEETKAEKGIDLDIDLFKLSNGKLVYTDLPGGLDLILSEINQNFSGIFRKEDLNIQTETEVGSIELKDGAIKYLDKAKLKFYLDLAIQDGQSVYVIKRGEAILNQLNVYTSGNVNFSENGSLILDLIFQSKESKVKDLFSLIPNSFKGTWDQVQSSGAFKIDGFIKGQYNDSLGIYPSFKMDLGVADGSVKYPGMKFSLDQINFNISAKDDGNQLNQTDLLIHQFDFALNNRPFSGKLSILNLQNEFKADGNTKGSISLSDFSQFMPLESGTSLKGLLDMNMMFQFNKRNLETQSPEGMDVSGIIQITDLEYLDKQSPDLKISNLKMEFSKFDCLIDPMQLNYGKSDCQGNGKIKNPMSLVSGAGKSEIFLNISGNELDLNELMEPDTNITSTTTTQSVSSSSQTSNPLAGIELTMNAKYNRIIYEDYNIRNAETEIEYIEDELKIKHFSSQINDNDLTLTGEMRSLMAYVNDQSRLNGDLRIKGGELDVLKFMGSEPQQTSQTSEESVAFEVPTGMDLNINFEFKKILYDNWQFGAPQGLLSIIDHEMQLKKFKSSTLGGIIDLKGLYNSKNPKSPVFDLKYDMSKVNFGKAFESIDMVRKIAPIFKYIEGHFNTTLVCSGALDGTMAPVYNSINLDGFIETIDGFIKSYTPLERIGNKLGVDEIKSYSLQNTKNWVHLENGTLKLSPGEKKIKDINVKYQGTHQVLGDMDYQFVFKIPKSKFKNSILGDAAESGTQFIKGLASKTGLDIKTKSHVNISVNLTGKLLDPKVGFKLLGEDGADATDEAKEMVQGVAQSASDSIRKKADAELENLKRKAIEKTNRAEDSLRAIANKKIQEEKDKAIKKATDELKKNVDSNLVNKGKDVLGEKATKEAEKILKEGGKKEMDQIKDKVNEWNPFKKKKE